MHFLLNGLSIVLIDLLLAGDNALVIAMALRSLPMKERRLGIVCGAGAAVGLMGTGRGPSLAPAPLSWRGAGSQPANDFCRSPRVLIRF